MFKIVNLSSSHLSIEGTNVPPCGYLNVKNVDHNVRYLEGKKAVSVSWYPDPVIKVAMVTPVAVTTAYTSTSSKRKGDK